MEMHFANVMLSYHSLIYCNLICSFVQLVMYFHRHTT